MYDLAQELLPEPIPNIVMRRGGGLFDETGVIASTDDAYRYVLWKRQARGASPATLCVFVLLNPSVADETKKDPTFTKCANWAARWDCDGVVLVNLFAMRATDPAKLRFSRDPVGPHNALFVTRVLGSARVGRIVLAWGNEGTLHARDEAFMVVHGHRELVCLEPRGKEALTKLGAPRHPVRLGYDCKLKRIYWEGAITTGTGPYTTGDRHGAR